MSAPRVLVTLDTGYADRRGVSFAAVEQKAAYAEAIANAGGLPLWVGPTAVDLAHELVDAADALVITGGDFDIPPDLYGATQRAKRVDKHKPQRTGFELGLLRAALDRGRPVLGICGGMQLLAVALGGQLVQDIRQQIEAPLEHEQPSSPTQPHHTVHVEPGTLLAELASATRIEVNSTHHQSVSDPGALDVWGRAPDGVVEAIGERSGRVMGVQWHPELLDDAVSRALYGHLVRTARR